MSKQERRELIEVENKLQLVVRTCSSGYTHQDQEKLFIPIPSFFKKVQESVSGKKEKKE